MQPKALYVGIDVSRAKLDVSFIDGDRRTVRPPETFKNAPGGWASLKDAVCAAAKRLGEDVRVVCGMESTSNMHKGVEQALRSESRCEVVEVHVVNPRAIKNFGKVLLKDTKTDRVDCRLIAEYLLRMQPKQQTPLPEHFDQLREGTRLRRALQEELTSYKNRLHGMLREYLPDYTKLISKVLTKSLLTVLIEYPSPHLMLAASQEEIAEVRSGRRYKLGAAFAAKVHDVARTAPQQCLLDLTQQVLRMTAQRIFDLWSQLSALDEAIEELVETLYPDHPLTSIPGIGRISAGAILAEVGDISRFPTKRHFVGYCGLYPVICESGASRQTHRMTRKGNRMLKLTFLVASAAARQYNPVIDAQYRSLTSRGKPKKAAGGAIARKLAEIVYTILRTGQPWCDEAAQAGMAKSQAMRTAQAA